VINATIAYNKIDSIRSASTFSASGIYIVTASNAGTNMIANNALTNMGTNGTSGDFGSGIFVGGGAVSTNIYFNSVSMSGTFSGGNQPNFALAIGGSNPVVNIRNNALSARAVNGGGVTLGIGAYAIGYAYSTFTNLTVNNNDYFTSGAEAKFAKTGSLASASGTDVANLAALQAVTGQDGASISADPLFNGLSNLRPQLGSPLLGAGVPAGSITDDVLCVIRSGSTPTIGSYEVAVDGAAPVISYTALGGTCGTGNRILTATISDPTGVPTSGILQPRIYYKKNAGAWFSSQGMLTSGSGMSGTWDFTIISSDMGGIVVTDVISYYVIAQDAAGSPNIGSNPSAGLVATDVNTITTPPTTPNTYIIQNTLAGGTYTVGASGTYPTLTAAVNVYNTSCLAGPVIFQLDDATYTTPNETFPITINANPYASSTNTLTIKPSVTSSINGSSTNSIIKLNGADFVTIDGSTGATVNSICPLVKASRNLTIENTNTSGVVLWIASTVSDGSTSDTIKNCIITGNAPSTTVAGVIVSGSVVGTAAEISNNNISIINNAFTKSQNGIFAIGSAATPDQNWIFNLNEMGSTVAGNKLGFRGIAVQNAQNFTVAKNIISGVISTSGSSATMTGILVGATLNGGNVYQNYISDIKQINTTGWGSNGIFLNASTTVSNVNVYNNFISEVASDGFADVTFEDNGYGIMVNTGGGYNIDFNTIVLTANQVKTTGLPAAINIASGVTTPATLKIRNNIFGNTQTIGTERFAIISTASNTVFHTIDNNDYFTAGPNLGRYNITPNFISLVAPADLKLNVTNNYWLNGMGIPVAGITNDYDCDPMIRDINTPDIGADEFEPPCSTIVVNSGDDINTMGTLRNLLNCVVDGGMLTFDAGVPTSFITAPLLINKNVTLTGAADIDFDFSLAGLLTGPYGLRVAASKTVTLDDINIIDKNNTNATPPSVYPVIDLLGTLKTIGSTSIIKQ